MVVRCWKKDKAKPDFTNVRSGGSTTAPAPEPQADGDPSPVGSADTDTYYVVLKGGTLSSIARRQYGDVEGGAGSLKRTGIRSRTPT